MFDWPGGHPDLADQDVLHRHAVALRPVHRHARGRWRWPPGHPARTRHSPFRPGLRPPSSARRIPPSRSLPASAHPHTGTASPRCSTARSLNIVGRVISPAGPAVITRHHHHTPRHCTAHNASLRHLLRNHTKNRPLFLRPAHPDRPAPGGRRGSLPEPPPPPRSPAPPVRGRRHGSGDGRHRIRGRAPPVRGRCNRSGTGTRSGRRRSPHRAGQGRRRPPGVGPWNHRHVRGRGLHPLRGLRAHVREPRHQTHPDQARPRRHAASSWASPSPTTKGVKNRSPMIIQLGFTS